MYSLLFANDLSSQGYHHGGGQGPRYPNGGFTGLSLTSCLVRPVTLRRVRFPSGPKPSETAPTYRFLVESK